MRGFGGKNPPRDETYRWDPQKSHFWSKPRRLIYNMWDSSARGRLCACPRNHRKKSPPVDNVTYMGSRDPPADYYQLWPTWWSCQRYQFCANFCFDRLRGFCSARCWKWPFLYLATTDHNSVQSATAPTRGWIWYTVIVVPLVKVIE
jgi:hypothetical protein